MTRGSRSRRSRRDRAAVRLQTGCPQGGFQLPAAPRCRVRRSVACPTCLKMRRRLQSPNLHGNSRARRRVAIMLIGGLGRPWPAPSRCRSAARPSATASSASACPSATRSWSPARRSSPSGYLGMWNWEKTGARPVPKDQTPGGAEERVDLNFRAEEQVRRRAKAEGRVGRGAWRRTSKLTAQKAKEAEAAAAAASRRATQKIETRAAPSGGDGGTGDGDGGISRARAPRRRGAAASRAPRRPCP